jgi:hypothetical protein
MIKKRKIVHLFHFLLLSTFVVLLNEILIITEPGLQLELPDIFFMIGSLVSLVWFVLLFDYYSKSYKTFNWIFLLVTFGYFLINVLSLYFTEGRIDFVATNLEGESSNITFYVDLMDRYKSGYFALSSMMMVYLSLVILPQIFADRTLHRLFFYFLVAIVYMISIYSWIVEWTLYEDLYVRFIFGGGNTYGPFSNPNVFGFYITLAIFGLGYLESIRHHVWHYALMVPLFLTLLPTYNITGYVGTAVFFFIFFGYDILATYQKNKWFSALKLMVMMGTLYTLLLFFAFDQHPFFVIFRDQVIPGSIRSFESRFAIWNHGLEIVQGLAFWFGRGVYIAHQLLAEAMSVENFATINRFHNGYLDLLATGGIIKVVFYYLIQLGFLIRIVQWIKINPKLGTTMLALFIGFHLQSIPEAKVLLEGDSMGLISTILILTPLGVEPKTVTTQLRFSSFF